MKKFLNIFFAMALTAALGIVVVACGNGSEPPPEPPPDPPKEPQEVNYYYYGDQKFELRVMNNRVIVQVATAAEAESLCENEIFISDEQRPFAIQEWILASIDPETTTVEDVRELPGIVSATYGMEYNVDDRCYPTNQIFVRPVEGLMIESIIMRAGLSEYVEKAEPSNPSSDVYLITLNLDLEYILWASNELFETGWCTFAEPNFFRESKRN